MESVIIEANGEWHTSDNKYTSIIQEASAPPSDWATLGPLPRLKPKMGLATVMVPAKQKNKKLLSLTLFLSKLNGDKNGETVIDLTKTVMKMKNVISPSRIVLGLR